VKRSLFERPEKCPMFLSMLSAHEEHQPWTNHLHKTPPLLDWILQGLHQFMKPFHPSGSHRCDHMLIHMMELSSLLVRSLNFCNIHLFFFLREFRSFLSSNFSCPAWNGSLHPPIGTVDAPLCWSPISPSSTGFIDHKRSPSLIASIDVSHSRHTSKARTFSSYPSLFDVEEMRPYHSQKTVDRSFIEACRLEFRPAFQILSSLSKLTCASQP